MIEKIIRRIKNMIRWGRVTNIDKDDKQFPQNQYQYFDKVKDIVTIYPYGHHAKAPLNSIALLVNVGHEENSAAIEMSGDERPKGLKAGEAVFGNFVIGSIIKFHQDGKIEIIAKNDIDITCDGEVNINTSKVTINGNLDVTGTITAPTITTTAGKDLGTHIHFVPGPIPGNTNPPT